MSLVTGKRKPGRPPGYKPQVKPVAVPQPQPVLSHQAIDDIAGAHAGDGSKYTGELVEQMRTAQTVLSEAREALEDNAGLHLYPKQYPPVTYTVTSVTDGNSVATLVAEPMMSGVHDLMPGLEPSDEYFSRVERSLSKLLPSSTPDALVFAKNALDGEKIAFNAWMSAREQELESMRAEMNAMAATATVERPVYTLEGDIAEGWNWARRSLVESCSSGDHGAATVDHIRVWMAFADKLFGIVG